MTAEVRRRNARSRSARDTELAQIAVYTRRNTGGHDFGQGFDTLASTTKATYIVAFVCSKVTGILLITI